MINFKNSTISKKKIADYIYIFAFSIFTIIIVLKTTMFRVYIPNNLYNIIRISALCMILGKIILFDKYSVKQIIKYIIIVSCVVLVNIMSGYSDLFDLVIILFGARNVQLKNIVKTYFLITTIIVTLSILASKAGIIQNLQYFRPDGKIRESLGLTYPTDFSAHIFYLILSYCYVKKKQISYIDIIVFISLAIFTNVYNDARLDSISILLTAVVFFFMKIRTKCNFGKIINIMLKYSVSICAIVSIGITIAYNQNQYNDAYIHLDKILSSRLNLGSTGIDTYGFSAFGQQITLIGNGGTMEKINNYFFIDCSYLLIALKYGTIFLVMICMLFVLNCNKYIKNNNYKILIIVALIAMNSMIAHHFLDLAYNPFIMMIATPVEREVYQDVKRRFKLDFSFKRKRLSATQ